MKNELDIAIKAARAAGAITEKYFGNPVEASEKAPDHPVTQADIEANAAIKKIIRSAFPDDGWLSEECADTTERLEKDRVWIIDPIDGTKEFIAGMPEYVISIALAIDGRPILGVIYQPTTDRLYSTADRGNLRMTPSDPTEILVSRTEHARGLWQGATTVATTPFGSIAHKIVRVAAGEFDGAITLQPRSEWDIAAAHAIISAAGGAVTDHAGNEITYNCASPVTSTGVIAGSSEFIEWAKKNIRS